jgi:LysR family hydrogen peroxide-inducible transcriptional activator
MPSISQLEYLLAVRQTGHFGRAAELVGVSQPTLSAQIQKAEVELGLTVFDRQKHPIEATELGVAMLEHARVVVDAHANLMRLAEGRFAGPAGPFALGIIPTLAPYVLPWFLRTFSETHAAVELSIYERPTDQLLSEIAHGRLDGAILVTPLDERGIEERVLFYDPFYLYGHPDEPLLSDPEVDVGELDPRKLWLLEDGHCFRTQVLNFCHLQERVHLGSVHFAGGSLETIRNLIDASEGYTLVPETYARTLPRATRSRSVRAFCGHTPTREVSLVHHKNSYKRDVIDALERVIASTTPRALRQAGPQGEVVSLEPKAHAAAG